MSPLFLELNEGDFDAYLPERASSNAFSRPRLEFKQRALGWAKSVADRLHSIGIPVDMEASDEHPSVRNNHRVDEQWIIFWRPAEQRQYLDPLLDQHAGIAQSLRNASPWFRHAFLALRLDSEHVEVCACLHPDAWIDLQAFHAKLNDDDRAQSIIDTILALPEEFQFGVSGQSPLPIASASIPALRELAQSLDEHRAALWFGWWISRATALQHAQLLGEQLEDALIALGPLYQILAWQQQDDVSELGRSLEAMHIQRSQAAAQRAEAERMQQQESERLRQVRIEQSREITRERVEYDSNRSRPTLATLFKSTSSTAATPPSPATPRTATPTPPAAIPHNRPVPRAREFTPKPKTADRPPPPQPQPAFTAGGTLDKGAQVRVLSGPFVGKIGIVAELDTRGNARVMLGLLSTRLLAEQLEAVVDSNERPSLQSCHRKNSLLTRSGK